MTAVLVSVIGGCTFDRSAGLDPCDEGDRRSGEVCRDGRWIAVDTGIDGGVADTAGGSVDGAVEGDGQKAGADGGDGCQPSEETCNGSDDDCDGVVDEGCPCPYMGSSTGVCADGTRSGGGQCQPPAEYSQIEGVGPNDCGDGLDNDCDGDVDGEDSDCGCTAGERRDCYTGPPSTAETGICTGGHQVCLEGEWQDCMNEQLPADEEICGNNADEDCDGVVGEGCRCQFQGRSEGICGAQMRDAQGNCPEPATYEPPTDSEQRCDQLDNDCDGHVDEGCPCDYRGRTAGVCGGQTRNAEGTCRKPAEYDGGAESGALCDGLDNDCDGRVDEDDCECVNGDAESCYTGRSGTAGVGICQKGTHRCRQGSWGACSGETTPEADESCGDSRDTDCNGVPDNGCPCHYDGTSTGVCGSASKDKNGTCQAPADYESTESSCDDGLDNDCDGAVDANDPDCRKPPGGSCSSDAECRGSCVSGACVHRLFVTSTTTDGAFGGLQGGDGICGQLARGQNLGGQWKALLSTAGTAVTSRVSVQAAVYNLNGDKIADGASDLWDGDIDNPVGYDERGGTASGDVWTGTEKSGAAKQADCNGWSSDSRLTGGQEGRADKKESRWVEDNDGLFDAESCNNNLPLYCIEQK